MSFAVASFYNFRKFMNRLLRLDFAVRKSEENDSPKGREGLGSFTYR